MEIPKPFEIGRIYYCKFYSVGACDSGGAIFRMTEDNDSIRMKRYISKISKNPVWELWAKDNGGWYIINPDRFSHIIRILERRYNEIK